MNKNTLHFKKIAFIIKVVACIIITSLLFMLFGTGLEMTVKSSGSNHVTTYSNAYSFIFGGALTSEHISYKAKSVSALGIIGFILIILSLIGIIISIVLSNKKRNVSSLSLFGSFLLIIASSIIMLSMHYSAASILANAITGNASDAVVNTIYNNTSLCFGFIGPGVFGLLSAMLIIVSYFFDGTIDKIRTFLAK